MQANGVRDIRGRMSGALLHWAKIDGESFEIPGRMSYRDSEALAQRREIALHLCEEACEATRARVRFRHIGDSTRLVPAAIGEIEAMLAEERRQLTGQCLCGAVRYAVLDAFLYSANCHCSQCRRTTGSAFKPFAGIERNRLSLVHGEDDVMRYGDEQAHDVHCRQCGSLLYSVVRGGQYVHVAMGTLVDEPSIRPDKHIFVGSKASWFTIADGLPQFQEHAS